MQETRLAFLGFAPSYACCRLRWPAATNTIYTDNTEAVGAARRVFSKRRVGDASRLGFIGRAVLITSSDVFGVASCDKQFAEAAIDLICLPFSECVVA